MVEGRLEGLVFNEQALRGGEMGVGGREGFLKPSDALADGLCAGIVGAVGDPEGDVAGAELFANLDGFEDVLESLGADLGRGIGERAELVLLVLKEVGIDGAGADSVAALEGLYFLDVGESVGQIPEDVEGHGGSDAGEAMDLGRVGKFLFDGGGGGGLGELAEARAGVCEAPGGNLDLEAVENLSGAVEPGGFGLGRCWMGHGWFLVTRIVLRGRDG